MKLPVATSTPHFRAKLKPIKVTPTKPTRPHPGSVRPGRKRNPAKVKELSRVTWAPGRALAAWPAPRSLCLSFWRSECQIIRLGASVFSLLCLLFLFLSKKFLQGKCTGRDSFFRKLGVSLFCNILGFLAVVMTVSQYHTSFPINTRYYYLIPWIMHFIEHFSEPTKSTPSAKEVQEKEGGGGGERPGERTNNNTREI